jgi:DNA-binding NtrC family response regulator
MQDEKPKILVVDDESDTLLYLFDLLTAEGYFVEGSSNPDDALSGILRRPPAVVLADVRMPGMDGFELLRAIRSVSPKTRVLLMSALGDEEAERDSERRGAEAFLRKPLRRNELLGAIERATRQVAG